jgi:hypothetical protein
MERWLVGDAAPEDTVVNGLFDTGSMRHAASVLKISTNFLGDPTGNAGA